MKHIKLTVLLLALLPRLAPAFTGCGQSDSDSAETTVSPTVTAAPDQRQKRSA